MFIYITISFTCSNLTLPTKKTHIAHALRIQTYLIFKLLFWGWNLVQTIVFDA